MLSILTSCYSIKENASASRLLQLPLEIRHKIWTEVLGNRLVHVKYCNDFELSLEAYEDLHDESEWSHKPKKKYGSAWRHLVCKEDCPRNHEGSKLTTQEEEEDDDWPLPRPPCEWSLDYNPTEPSTIYEEGDCDGHEMMHLGVLRSCRQIYTEANRVLWTTNTFSFADPATFKRFMMTRNIHQKRFIRSLHLKMHLDLSCAIKDWNSFLNMSLVKSLCGLRQLALHITFGMSATSYERAKSDHYLYPAIYCESVQRISTLALTEVDVFVENPEYNSSDLLWTKSDRKEFAEHLRDILLNPKGAEVYAEDQLKQKEADRKDKEFWANVKATMYKRRRQIRAEATIDSPLPPPSA